MGKELLEIFPDDLLRDYGKFGKIIRGPDVIRGQFPVPEYFPVIWYVLMNMFYEFPQSPVLVVRQFLSFPSLALFQELEFPRDGSPHYSIAQWKNDVPGYDWIE